MDLLMPGLYPSKREPDRPAGDSSEESEAAVSQVDTGFCISLVDDKETP